MTYDYFYGQQAEMFAFYRVPKVLFTEDCFWNVSTDAKLLYGILLDRMNLSARNGWLDEEGRVYIIFTIEEIKGALKKSVYSVWLHIHQRQQFRQRLERYRLRWGCLVERLSLRLR